MSHHNELPMFTAEDMEEVLAKLRKAEREAELSHQLLWAVVHSAGGEVAVPHRLWIEVEDDNPREIIMWDDVPEHALRLKVRT